MALGVCVHTHIGVAGMRPADVGYEPRLTSHVSLSNWANRIISFVNLPQPNGGFRVVQQLISVVGHGVTDYSNVETVAYNRWKGK